MPALWIAHVTVTDDEDPTIACPADVDQTADAGVCEALVTIPAPSTDDYIPDVSPTDKKPYVPPEDRGKDKKKDKKKKKEYKPKKKSHFLRNMFLLLLLGGGAYYYHKNYGFDFSFLQRYRRFRPVSGYDQGDMYSGLTMESSTSFQPPSLPPTPIDMGSGNGGHFI